MLARGREAVRAACGRSDWARAINGPAAPSLRYVGGSGLSAPRGARRERAFSDTGSWSSSARYLGLLPENHWRRRARAAQYPRTNAQVTTQPVKNDKRSRILTSSREIRCISKLAHLHGGQHCGHCSTEHGFRCSVGSHSAALDSGAGVLVMKMRPWNGAQQALETIVSVLELCALVTRLRNDSRRVRWQSTRPRAGPLTPPTLGPWPPMDRPQSPRLRHRSLEPRTAGS